MDDVSETCHPLLQSDPEGAQRASVCPDASLS